MKYLPRAFTAFSASVLATFAIHAQSQTQEKPKFQIEIQAAAQAGPKFTLTNLPDKPLTAYVIQISSSSDNKGRSEIVSDAPVQGERPLEPGASITQNLNHRVGGPMPDKVEVIAGIWTDGETFGQADWVKMILQGRALWASQYNQATSLLQRGLDQSWTRDRYLEALKSVPNSAAVYSIRSTLELNPQVDGNPQLLERIVRSLLETMNQRSEILRQAKPQASITPAP
jgi:hypothetical protein